MKKFTLLFLFFSLIFLINSNAQHSIARRWNEVQLAAIRQDLARPPVQARNLFHVAVAMYDAWAAYNNNATTYLLGKTINGTLYSYSGTPPLINNDTAASQQMAICYAAFRVLRNRYQLSPNMGAAFFRFDSLMNNLGYDTTIISTDYTNGTPADFGNYIAQQIIMMGNNDGARQLYNYSNAYYAPINPLLFVDSTGTPGLININRWQPLHIVSAVDQNNNPISSNQVAVCHEWGNVTPFTEDPTTSTWHFRSGNIYKTYQDPGGPSKLDTIVGNDSSSLHFKWANEMVAVWGSFHTPDDTTTEDISPNSKGNLPTFPIGLYNQFNYYNYFNGGDTSHGHPINPITTSPYTPQIVKRGDYTRVISQYWADGPQSETPPGHWHLLFNKISDNPLLVKKYEGQGTLLSNLEWDIKGYFTLSGAMHDAAIEAWALKGWYDSPRPITAIRKMCDYGQCTDSLLPHYNKAGINLIPGYIELISATDSLALIDTANINKIKIKNWLGFSKIDTPSTKYAGVGWTLGEKWIPYQRKGFVTPPFSGYVSGHSTYSRAGAEVLSRITGSDYFPGGIYETLIPANSNFLQFEKGPSTDITLQWATYRDASNEASLSRIFGGIHPPTDDATGRLVGETIGINSVTKAKLYFSSFALPVTLAYFNAQSEKCKTNIFWSSSIENNSLGYEVWRSENGTDFDTKITTVPSVGFSNHIENYFAVDTLPTDRNNYRLIGVDIDGKRTILAQSSLLIKNCNGSSDLENSLSLYPMPISDKLIITYNNNIKQDELIDIKILDVLGNIVYSKAFLFSPQNLSNEVTLSALSTGNYLIQFNTESGEKFVKKIVKN